MQLTTWTNQSTFQTFCGVKSISSQSSQSQTAACRRASGHHVCLSHHLSGGDSLVRQATWAEAWHGCHGSAAWAWLLQSTGECQSTPFTPLILYYNLHMLFKWPALWGWQWRAVCLCRAGSLTIVWTLCQTGHSEISLESLGLHVFLLGQNWVISSPSRDLSCVSKSQVIKTWTET